MRLYEPGVVKLYSADPEWIAGSGCNLAEKRSHPIFHILSFIDSVFPDIGAKNWEWLMPESTALVRTSLHTYGHSDFRDCCPAFNYLPPIYTEVLMILSGAESLHDSRPNRIALARLIKTLHVLD